MAIVILSGGWGIRPLWSRTFGGTDLANERGGGLSVVRLTLAVPPPGGDDTLFEVL